jgi:hypothetical protein
LLSRKRIAQFPHPCCARFLPINFAESLESAEVDADAKNTMWCPLCRESLPNSALADQVCPQCGLALRADPAHAGPAAVGQAPPVRAARSATEGQRSRIDLEPPLGDNWELEEELRHVERVLSLDRVRSGPKLAAPQPATETRRLDASHGLPARHTSGGTRTKGRGRASDIALQALTWTVLSLGLMAFVCGGALLGWSLATDRDELWRIGLPVALGGQVVLLVGLILLLDRLWHDSRSAADKLEHVDQHLDRLQRTTQRLSQTAFTRIDPLADANPQALLADLKDRLDLLARKIGHSKTG